MLKTNDKNKTVKPVLNPALEQEKTDKKSRPILKLLIIGLALFGSTLIANGAIKSSNSKQPQAAAPVLPRSTAPTIQPYNIPNPERLNIPSLNIDAGFEQLALGAKHGIEVPVESMAVGWFIYGAKPGEVGTAVIVGHLDSAKGPAVFADLHKITLGSEISIERSNGSVVVYTVERVEKFSQDNFPTAEVYGQLPYPAIRLITCSGSYNKKAARYSDNLIVFGRIK
ncbi:MAG: class F sortase [Candidatus Doudnabacteria bacterium]|nr:class F sortase [Candidatus Doudnabacteria bacterium]